MVHFVGAGSGAADLITLRGKKFLEEADVVIYAGSLVNPQVLAGARPDAEIYNSAQMTLPEVVAVMKKAEEEGKTVARVHTGDPAIYGAHREQMVRLDELVKEGKIKPELVIGVPVGFVNVVESKEIIMKTGIPYIVARGRKGGSNVAAAICNALIYKLTRK